MIDRFADLATELRQRRAVRFILTYALGAWITAQVAGFFVEQGYVSRRVLDVTLFLLVVFFLVLLVLVWYHGERGHQKIRRTEAVLLGALGFVAVGGSIWLGSREAGGRAGFDPAEAVVALGDSSLAVLPFVNELDDPGMAWLDRGVADLLATDLTQLSHLRVVSGQRLFDLLRQLGEEETRSVPEDLQAVVTRRAGARYMLTGRIAGSSGPSTRGYPVMRSLLALEQGEKALEQVGVARRAGIGGLPGDFEPITIRVLQYFEGRARELSGDPAGARAAYERLIRGWGEAAASVPLVADVAERLARLRT